MPSFLPIALRPSFASWLNERSCKLPMSVTIAILKPSTGLGVCAVVLVAPPPLPSPPHPARKAAPIRRTIRCRPLIGSTFPLLHVLLAGVASRAEGPPRRVHPPGSALAHGAPFRRRRADDAVTARRALETDLPGEQCKALLVD